MVRDRLKRKDIWRPVPSNPVLRRGGRDDWDSDAVLDPCLVTSDKGCIMWYSGRRQETLGEEGKRVYARIGRAVSEDGLRWKKYDSPVLEGGPEDAWDSAHVYCPFVLETGGGFRMYYHGDDAHPGRSQIGMALSDDGLTWRKHPGNPVVRCGEPGELDDFLVAVPNVFELESGFAMIYSQVAKRGKEETWAIALAVSADGIMWEKKGSVIGLGEKAKSISSPSVLSIDGRYYLWAWVFDHDRMEENHVRLYESEDLMHWQAVWETGWTSPWAENEVSRRFFMPRVFRIYGDRLLLFYPIRYDRGVCDTGLAIVDLRPCESEQPQPLPEMHTST